MLHVQSMAYWRQHAVPCRRHDPGQHLRPLRQLRSRARPRDPGAGAQVRRGDREGGTRPGRGLGQRASRPATTSTPAMWPGACCGPRRSTTSRRWSTSRRPETSILEVVDLLTEITGIQWPGRMGQRPPRWPESAQIRRLEGGTGARFRVRDHRLRQGLEVTVNWYREHRHEARNVMTFPTGPRVASETPDEALIEP